MLCIKAFQKQFSLKTAKSQKSSGFTINYQVSDERTWLREEGGGRREEPDLTTKQRQQFSGQWQL